MVMLKIYDDTEQNTAQKMSKIQSDNWLMQHNLRRRHFVSQPFLSGVSHSTAPSDLCSIPASTLPVKIQIYSHEWMDYKLDVIYPIIKVDSVIIFFCMQNTTPYVEFTAF